MNMKIVAKIEEEKKKRFFLDEGGKNCINGGLVPFLFISLAILYTSL